MRKHILPLLLCLIMVMSFMPTTALAGTVTQIPYIDENGNTQYITASDVTEVTSNTGRNWNAASGWYVVSGTDVTIEGPVSLSSNTNLILADGAKLTVTGTNSGITCAVSFPFTIYAQSAGTGKLAVSGSTGVSGSGSGNINFFGGVISVTNSSDRAIHSEDGSINISNATVFAESRNNAIDSINGSINISNATVTAKSNNGNAIYSCSGLIEISNANVTAEAKSANGVAIHSSGSIEISNATVTAKSSGTGIITADGSITITNANVSADGGNGITAEKGSVAIENSKVVATGGNVPSSSGVYAKDVTISAKSDVTASATYYGIHAIGSATFTDSTVKATAKTDNNSSNGIAFGETASSRLTIVGGNVVADGNGSGIYAAASTSVLCVNDGTFIATGNGGRAIFSNNPTNPVVFGGAYLTPARRTVMVSSTTDADATTWDEETLLTTYKYVSIAPPAPTPTPTHGGTPIYYWSNQNPQPETTPTLPDVDTSAGAPRNGPASIDKSVWLTGEGLMNNDLLITAPLSDAAAAVLIKNTLGEVIGAYDISLASGKTTTGNALTLHFDLGEKYAGQSFTLLHQKADGTVETFTAIADEKGIVSFSPIYELSPFVLIMNKSKAADNDLPPQTGDSFTAVGFIMAAIAMAIAAVVAVKRRNAERI